MLCRRTYVRAAYRLAIVCLVEQSSLLDALKIQEHKTVALVGLAPDNAHLSHGLGEACQERAEICHTKLYWN